MKFKNERLVSDMLMFVRITRFGHDTGDLIIFDAVIGPIQMAEDILISNLVAYGSEMIKKANRQRDFGYTKTDLDAQWLNN